MRKIVFLFLFSALVFNAVAEIVTAVIILYVNDYSQWNTKRPVRAHTYYIVLHTTEAGNKSSLNAVKKSGTCNYLVTTDGVIHRIIDKSRVAKHAGRSLWNNHSNLSNCSIGIEVVGYHDKKPNAKQLAALKILIADLQKMYGLSDQSVVTHSMVAYGAPDRWHPYNHRGRKRCGMLFATPEIRQAIGLSNVFTVDPDVKAGRLKNADPYLAQVLYGTHETSEEEDEKFIAAVDTSSDDQFEGLQIVGASGVFSIAGNEYDESSTIYFFPDNTIRTGKEVRAETLNHLPVGTKVLVGYVYGGKLSKERTAYSVVGKDWDLPSTFYRFPDGTVKTGDEVDGSKMPIGTIILFRT